MEPYILPRNTGYLHQCFLGEGRYGQVSQCLKLDTRETVAVKVLKDTKYRLAAKAEVRTSARK